MSFVGTLFKKNKSSMAQNPDEPQTPISSYQNRKARFEAHSIKSQQMHEANERRKSQIGSMASASNASINLSMNRGQESFFEEGYEIEEQK